MSNDLDALPEEPEDVVSARIYAADSSVLRTAVDYIDALRAHCQRNIEARLSAQREAHKETLEIRNVTDPCEHCGGYGVRTYGSTATWRGGVGGQAMTSDICDKCWGSGDKSKTWPSRRAPAEARAREMEMALRYWRDECSGAEPSLSVFNRMADEALQPKGDGNGQ